MTCSYSKEFNLNSVTDIDNKFIDIYLPIATGDAVKVYLYGLFACKSEENLTLESFSKNLWINFVYLSIIDIL